MEKKSLAAEKLEDFLGVFYAKSNEYATSIILSKHW